MEVEEFFKATNGSLRGLSGIFTLPLLKVHKILFKYWKFTKQIGLDFF